MRKIEAVIFDLGRVLVNVDVTRGIFKYLSNSQHSTEDVVEKMMCDPVYGAYNAGKLSSEEFHKRTCARFRLDLDFDTFTRLWCDVFGPMPGAAELVEELSGRVKLGILSDTDPLHWAFILKNYPFTAKIPMPTLSFETGYRKPAWQAFEAALLNTGSPAERTLYIDDLGVNVLGAMKAGMQAVQFEKSAQIRIFLQDVGIL